MRRVIDCIAFLARHPEASVSARLRDMHRKGHLVNRRTAREGKLPVYQVVVQPLAERPACCRRIQARLMLPTRVRDLLADSRE